MWWSKGPIGQTSSLTLWRVRGIDVLGKRILYRVRYIDIDIITIDMIPKKNWDWLWIQTLDHEILSWRVWYYTDLPNSCLEHFSPETKTSKPHSDSNTKGLYEEHYDFYDLTLSVRFTVKPDSLSFNSSDGVLVIGVTRVRLFPSLSFSTLYRRVV